MRNAHSCVAPSGVRFLKPRGIARRDDAEAGSATLLVNIRIPRRIRRCLQNHQP